MKNYTEVKIYHIFWTLTVILMVVSVAMLMIHTDQSVNGRLDWLAGEISSLEYARIKAGGHHAINVMMVAIGSMLAGFGTYAWSHR